MDNRHVRIVQLGRIRIPKVKLSVSCVLVATSRTTWGNRRFAQVIAGQEAMELMKARSITLHARFALQGRMPPLEPPPAPVVSEASMKERLVNPSAVVFVPWTQPQTILAVCTSQTVKHVHIRSKPITKALMAVLLFNSKSCTSQKSYGAARLCYFWECLATLVTST